MTLRTSLVIAGDASGATAALAETNAALGRAETEARQLADAYAKADVATTKLAQAQTRAAAETAAAKAAFAAGEATLDQYNQSLLITKTELGLVASAQSAATANLRASQAAFDAATAGAQRHTVSVGQARAGYQNLGRQAQDVSVQLSGGQSIGTIFAQQGPQIADAVAQMGGRFSGLAEFLAGPWGAAIFLGTSALLSFVPALLSAGDAAKDAEKASDDLSSRLSNMATFFDLATGAIIRQNQALIANAVLKRDDDIKSAQKAQAARGKEIKSLVARSAQGSYVSLGTGFAPAGEVFQGSNDILNAINGAKGNQAAISKALLPIIESKSVNSGIARRILELRGQAEVAQQDISKMLGENKSLNTGKLAAEFLKPKGAGRASNPKGRQPAKGPDFAGLDLSVGNSIANIADQFSEIPAQVDKTNKAMRQLDELGHKIEKNKLPNAGPLNEQLKATKQLVQDSLNKPFDDYVKAQRESAAVDQLLIAGRVDEAEALKVTLGLQKQQKDLLPGQLKTVVALVEQERMRKQVLRDTNALIQANVNAVLDMRRALEQTVGNVFRGKFSLDAVFSSIGNSFINITSKRIVESMFGDTLRSLEDQATGQDTVKAASNSIAASFKVAGDAATLLGQALDTSRGKVGATPASGAGDVVRNPTTGLATDPDTGEQQILVEGKRPAAANSPAILAGAPNGGFLVDMAAAIFGKATGIAVPRLIVDNLKPALAKIEQTIGGSITGAFTGSAASKLILGSGGSGIGGAIGGAIGQKVGEKFLTKGLESIGKSLGGLGSLAGPLGSIVGGVLGGLLGGLFNKAKTGGASVGLNQYGQAGVTGTGGNNATLKGQANSLGGSISQGLNQIAQQLGASLGQFSVAIGMRNDYFRVSASGSIASATTKHYSSDVIYDGKDQAQAVSVALANAIADGAIQGISARVQQALKSSTDIDQALREALKVQDLELALGGVGAALKKSFSDFELQAKERLRVAGQYGFDLVAVDKKNADDRLGLQKKLAADQIGSLQQLIDDLTSGSLFEGSTVDQAQAIRDQIAGVKAEVDAGTAGAADKLANLLNQLNSVSKDAYGTTAGFAADRATILDTARDSIAKTNQRVVDAQKATDPALAETNAALDENNAQNAQMLAALGILPGQIAAVLAQYGGSSTTNLGALARTS